MKAITPLRNFMTSSPHTHNRPCILQPSRVTYKSKTLIDNIFTNDLSCIVDGGNLTHKSPIISVNLFSAIFYLKHCQKR